MAGTLRGWCGQVAAVPRRLRDRGHWILLGLLLAVVLSGCADLNRRRHPGLADTPGLLEATDRLMVGPARFLLEKDHAGSGLTDTDLIREIELEIVAVAETLIANSRAGLVLGREEARQVATPGVADSVAPVISMLPTGLDPSSASILKIRPARSDSAGSQAQTPSDGVQPINLGDDVPGCTHILYVEGSGVYTTFGGRLQSSAIGCASQMICNSILAGIFGGEPAEVELEDELVSSVCLRAVLFDEKTEDVVWDRTVRLESFDGDGYDFRNGRVVFAVCLQLLEPLLGKSRLKPEPYRPQYLKD